MNNFFKSTIEHTPLVAYNESYPMYPIMSVLSFMSPSHALIYNSLANHPHWFAADNKSQLSIMQVCTPKMTFNYNSVYKNYVKKPSIPKTPDKTKLENWLMTVYEVPRQTAKEYLLIEGVEEEVRGRIK